MPEAASDRSAAGAVVAAVGERALIARIRGRLQPAPSWLIVDAGDDAAVVEPFRNELEAITTDAIVEGVHFDRRFTPARSIGHRAVAVNLSDLAAMGARPRLITLSLALPGDLLLDDFDALIEGAIAMAERAGVRLIGGNITSTAGPLVADVTAIGSVHRRRVLLREGARPGDYIFVSGKVGDARAGLAMLSLAGEKPAGTPAGAVAHYLHPEPRIRLGILLARNRVATAAVDLSDGLADGLARLSEASGLGCEIDAAALPVSDEARDFWRARDADPAREAVAGGDDYELLFTARPRDRGRLRTVARQCAPLPLTRIGVVTRSTDLMLVRTDGSREPIGGGYEHFGT